MSAAKQAAFSFDNFVAVSKHAKDLGLRTFSVGNMAGEFWPSAAPVNPVIAKIEQALNAPITQDEMYDVNDPDNPEPVEG